jgi:hypothetical protein
MPLLLYLQGNSPQYPQYRNWVGSRASMEAMEKIKILVSAGVKPYFLSRLASSVIAIITKLSWLHIVTRYLKGGVVEPEEWDVAMQQLDKHVSVAMDTHAIIEEILEMFSMEYVLRQYSKDKQGKLVCSS